MTPAKRIGKYPVIREIGKGAMGTVYEGFDPDTGAKVAIKILRAEHLADSRVDSASARFEREAQAGRRLQHPNIVKVLEYGEQGRIKFIAMEFLDGQELRQLMRERGRFELADAASVLQQLLDALDCSHRHGVVHRDIKPSNMMVIDPLVIKVMDFGIARIESAAFTQVGTLLGTLTHMSPEQMRGEPADGRADLWAAGVILYELLAGRSPFAAATSVGVTHHAMNLPHAPITQWRPELPAALDPVLDRALAKHRDDRYQSAPEFARALADAAAGSDVGSVDLDLAFGAQPTAATVDLPLDAFVASDETVIRPQPVDARPPRPLPSAFDPAALSKAEAQLAQYVGPMASLLVRQAAMTSKNLADLYLTLSRHITSEAKQRAFLNGGR